MRNSFMIALLVLGCSKDDGVSVDLTEASADCTFYADADGDGYADPFAAVDSDCDSPPEGTMAASEGSVERKKFGSAFARQHSHKLKDAAVRVFS